MFSIFGRNANQKPLKNMKMGVPGAKFVGTEIGGLLPLLGCESLGMYALVLQGQLSAVSDVPADRVSRRRDWGQA